MVTRMATVHQGRVGCRHSQAQAITRTRMVTRMATVHQGQVELPTFSSTGHCRNQNGDQDGYCSPGSGRLLTFSSTCHYKGIKKLQKVNQRPRLSITIDVLRMPISFLSFGCFGQCDDRMYRLIQAMGRWSSECYKRYIRLTKTSLRQARLGMAHTTHVR